MEPFSLQEICFCELIFSFSCAWQVWCAEIKTICIFSGACFYHLAFIFIKRVYQCKKKFLWTVINKVSVETRIKCWPVFTKTDFVICCIDSRRGRRRPRDVLGVGSVRDALRNSGRICFTESTSNIFKNGNSSWPYINCIDVSFLLSVWSALAEKMKHRPCIYLLACFCFWKTFYLEI